ncbi:hypothetical protein [Cyanobium sp. WAJ14-Wanaka]|uniref:hypothetical protein n=1 Tax=Cyanobium sp. WAJ14-Wanaka TaxID=2823725 RepID=UPI0020CDE170|nr:hypothetical protein [Cyanobium sp. WAJ14-Wanaka]MCP9774236.1 hypothetical protein [Cyanobium sp. WAJ14-Wanaka]
MSSASSGPVMQLLATDGGLEIRAIGAGAQMRLPLDEGIRLERASLEGGMVQLQGSAQISMGSPA